MSTTTSHSIQTLSDGSTFNQVGGDQVNHNFLTFVQGATSSDSSIKSTILLPFIDAPVDILTVHFTGRTEELARIKDILDSVGGNVPIRCVIHGMHGIGKSQLTLYFAISAFGQGRYKYVLWISATTVGKLQQGFVKLLDLIDHKDRFHPEQRARLTASRRWLEECDSKWLLVLDNVERDSLDFLREQLPRQNKQGNILFTTRTESLADILSNSAGQRHQILELLTPNVQDSANLLLEHSAGDMDEARTSRAKDVVKCVGCLPLAVAQAGSFMKQSGKSLDEMLDLYESDRKVEVRLLSLVSISEN
jgi:NB-ARC domain